MDTEVFVTIHQRIEAEINPAPGLIELNFNNRTLYFPGDRFRHNGKHYIVKKCYQAGDVSGDEILR